jgi:hypothetical protein
MRDSATWNSALLAGSEFEFSPRQFESINAAVQTRDLYSVGSDGRYLQPLIERAVLRNARVTGRPKSPKDHGNNRRDLVPFRDRAND